MRRIDCERDRKREKEILREIEGDIEISRVLEIGERERGR